MGSRRAARQAGYEPKKIPIRHDIAIPMKTAGMLTAAGSYTLEVAPGSLVDGAGNENGSMLSTTATK